MAEVRYVRIYCEEKRRRDMIPRGQRGGHAKVTPTTGLAYAVECDGHGRCCVCGKPVSVVRSKS